jgi:hypothetical protein
LIANISFLISILRKKKKRGEESSPEEKRASEKLYHFLLSIIKTFFSLPIFSISIRADPPLVTLQLGSTLTNDDIKEGDDVYFECHVEANPKFTKLSWLHNVSGKFTFNIHPSVKYLLKVMSIELK